MSRGGKTTGGQGVAGGVGGSRGAGGAGGAGASTAAGRSGQDEYVQVVERQLQAAQTKVTAWHRIVQNARDTRDRTLRPLTAAYAVFGQVISHDSSESEVKRAYVILIRSKQPDRNPQATAEELLQYNIEFNAVQDANRVIQQELRDDNLG